MDTGMDKGRGLEMARHPAFLETAAGEMLQRRALLSQRLQRNAGAGGAERVKTGGVGAGLPPPEPLLGVGARRLIVSRRRMWVYGSSSSP